MVGVKLEVFTLLSKGEKNGVRFSPSSIPLSTLETIVSNVPAFVIGLGVQGAKKNDIRDAMSVSIADGSFDAPNKEWAMFVMANRRPSRVADDHNRDNRYDLVVGPVANDDLALLFRQFERNLITVEMLVREMQFKRLTIQYSFHTQRALDFLKFVETRDVR